MSLGGPRLDRPSAIGDEGRPRAASLWIASLAVVATVGGVGYAIGMASLVSSLALIVGMTVAGVALLERDGFVDQFVAHAFLLTFGSAFALLLLAAPLVTRTGLAASGSALALAGIGAGWADIGDDELKSAAMGSLIGYVSMLGSAVLVLLLALVGFFGWTALTGISGVSTPVASLTAFLLVVAVTGTVVRLSLRWLPIRQLAPRDRRPAVEERLATGRRYLLYAVVGAIGGIVGIGVLAIAGVLDVLTTRLLLAGAFGALSSPFVVWPIVAIGAVSLVAGTVAWLLRRFTQQVTAQTTRRTAAAAVGFGLSLPFLIGLVLTIASSGVTVGPLLLGMALLVPLLVGPLAVVLVFGGTVVGIGVGLLPARATGPALAAAGLVVTAIGLGRADPILVFACIAVAVFVWDVSTFGLGVTAELGHLPETRRLELFHAALAVGIAIAAVIVAIGLELLRAGLFEGVGAAGATIVVVLGALILLIPLRG